MNKAIKSYLSAFAMLLPMCAMSANYSGEYYWNSDPGVGLAQKMAVADVGADGKMNTTLDASAALPGMNVLGMRVFNGQWSPTIVQYVFVPQDPASITQTVCEYWWDTDPGVGMCENTVTAATSGTGAIDLDLKAEGLTPGFHLLGIRSGINGTWSATVTAPVFVRDNVVALIDAAEYFWGDDPGFGNGTPIELAAAESITLENLEIDFPTTEQESYVLTIRAHSNVGGWGYSLVKTLTPTAPTGIEVDPAELHFDRPEEQAAIVASILPANAWFDGFEWESSDPAIATVDQDGLVTAVAEGECVITARVKGTEFSAQTAVTVDNIPLYKKGDANGDGEVNITDVVWVVNYAIGDGASGFIFDAADTNGDGEVNITDVVNTVNIVLMAGSNAPQRTAPTEANALYIPDFDINPGETKTVDVMLNNPDFTLSAFQFSLTLPEGLSIEEEDGEPIIDLTSRATRSHTVAAKLNDGTYIVMVYSSKNSNLSGNSGAVLTLPIVAAADFTQGVAEVTNVITTESDGTEHRLSSTSCTVNESYAPVEPQGTALIIEPFAIAPGEEKVVPVNLYNPDYAVTAFQFRMQLPEGLSVAEEDDELFIDLTDRATRSHTVASKLNDNGLYTIMVYSSKSSDLTGDSGAALEITFCAAENFDQGEINLTDIIFVEKDGTEHKLPDSTCSVSHLSGIAEDLSDDNANAVYYDLHGFKVSAEKLLPGIYIKISDGVATKVHVK